MISNNVTLIAYLRYTNYVKLLLWEMLQITIKKMKLTL